MRRFFWISFLVLLGCASAKPSGFLDNYAALMPGKYLERASESPELGNLKGALVEIELPKLLNISSDNEHLSGKEAQGFLKNALEVNLRTTSGFKVASPGETSVLKLETAITKLDPGSRSLRWFASELGAGHSLVQVEGRLIDSASGKIVFQFADRRAGSASGGLDITGGDAKEMMISDLDNIAKSIAETMRDSK